MSRETPDEDMADFEKRAMQLASIAALAGVPQVKRSLRMQCAICMGTLSY